MQLTASEPEAWPSELRVTAQGFTWSHHLPRAAELLAVPSEPRLNTSMEGGCLCLYQAQALAPPLSLTP